VRLVYDICSMRTQMITAFKRAFTVYASGSGMSTDDIKTMARMGCSVSIDEYCRTRSNITLEHRDSHSGGLMGCNENAVVLNIDDYHNIHTKRVSSTTSSSSAVHMATIFVIPALQKNGLRRTRKRHGKDTERTWKGHGKGHGKMSAAPSLFRVFSVSFPQFPCPFPIHSPSFSTIPCLRIHGKVIEKSRKKRNPCP
jgi:hypothetical protein